MPGTVLDQVDVAALSYIGDAWVNVPLNAPHDVSSGGVYLAFIHGADGVFLGTESTIAGPISRQSFEFVGGSWATYRENTNVDLLINGHFSFLSVGIEDELAANSLSVYPNPNSGLFTVKTTDEVRVIELHNTLGQSIPFGVTKLKGKLLIELKSAKPGMYIVKVMSQETLLVKQVIVQ